MACTYCGRPEFTVASNNLTVCKIHYNLYLSGWDYTVQQIANAAEQLGWAYSSGSSHYHKITLPNAVITWYGERYEYLDTCIDFRRDYDAPSEVGWSLRSGASVDLDDAYHPHAMFGEELCTGTGRRSIQNTLRQKDFLGFLVQAWQVACQYNPYDCYGPIVPQECSICHFEKDQYTMYYCEGCENWTCQVCNGSFQDRDEVHDRLATMRVANCRRCQIVCPYCGERVESELYLYECNECGSTIGECCRLDCEICENVICRGCGRGCARCGMGMCRSCAHTRNSSDWGYASFCDDCFDEVLGEQEQERVSALNALRIDSARFLAEIEWWWNDQWAQGNPPCPFILDVDVLGAHSTTSSTGYINPRPTIGSAGTATIHSGSTINTGFSTGEWTDRPPPTGDDEPPPPTSWRPPLQAAAAGFDELSTLADRAREALEQMNAELLEREETNQSDDEEEEEWEEEQQREEERRAEEEQEDDGPSIPF